MKLENSIFDRELIERCNINAPRYTSYPTADRFGFDFTREIQEGKLVEVFANKCTEPISLYIHIPFCNTLCLFCACNKIITNDRGKIAIYLRYLELELELYYAKIGKKLDVIQLHFGGGSPSWLSIDELNQLMALVRKYFNLDKAREIAMELDPRHTGRDFIEALRDNGFNRVSLGLQDFDAKVQKAVNRIQPYQISANVLQWARDFGFKSTNIDLIYGLPFQTLVTFTDTINKILDLRPERIALFNYAHIPNALMPQTRINDSDLPSAKEKLNILQMSVTKLSEAGYVFIGMDHFALPDDELALALKNGLLQRNFQGYSTFADTNMLSFGVSAIGFVGKTYYQNVKDLATYYSSLDNKQMPIMRGVVMNDDDIIRSYVISEIMCRFKLDYGVISQKFQIDFVIYFKQELEALAMLNELSLVDLETGGFMVNQRGRFVIRNIACVFDKYYNQRGKENRYSKSI